MARTITIPLRSGPKWTNTFRYTGGVRIWEHQPSMLHAKTVTVDDTVACVGSANFDQRSMSKNDELALLILEDGILSELDYHFREDCRRAKEMKAEDYRQRGLFKRAKTMVASLFKSQT